MVTYAQLKAADPGRIASGAGRASTVSRDFDTFAEDVVKQRKRLAGIWQGKDALAAVAHLSTHSRDYEQAVIAYEEVGSALKGLAAGITSAQRILADAHRMAAEVPAQIRDDGSVVALPATKSTQVLQDGVRAVAERIKEALFEARDADQRTNRRLAAVRLPDAANLSDKQLDGRTPFDDLSPEEAAAWWKGLSREEQEALKNEYPGRIGALDGVPAKDRDDANRILLAAEKERVGDRIKDIDAQLRKQEADVEAGRKPDITLGERAALEAEREKLAGQQDVLNKLDGRLQDPSKEPAFLLKFDPAGDGKVAVAIGDPDKADNVATYVPGTGGGLNDGYVGADIDRADITQRLAESEDPSKKTSVIAWQDYDSPDWNIPGPADDYNYKSAAKDLRDFQVGLRETHDGGPSRNTLIGHSYGGPVVGHAADQDNVKIDNLVHVASPGSGQGLGGDAGDYQGNPKVWATNGGNDVVGLLPVHGDNPVNDWHGSTKFDSGGATHTSYWDEKPFQDNISRIITGKYDEVTRPGGGKALPD